MRNEFALIDAIVEGLGDRAAGDWVSVGPGDDAAVITTTPGLAQVASIDTLLPDVHFPAAAPAQLIGYRALMVSFSDLAAMRAAPRYCLVSLSMDESQGAAWVVSLARGMADAARELGVYVCGGNLTRGPLNIAVSVHGEVEHQHLLRRSEGRPGQQLTVTGALGAAAACVRTGQMLPVDPKALTPLQHAYYRPQARFDVAAMVQAASAGLDISDGLSQDLAHLCAASGCGAALQSLSIPIGAGATLEDALFGGDDYELLVASNEALPGAYTIGVLTAEPGLTLDGAPFATKGFDHFGKDQ
jgi:thiamine-monophosphate kinase